MRVKLVDGLPDKRAGGGKRRWRARTSRPGGEAKANPLTDVSDEGVADGTRGRVRSPKRDAAELFESFASAGMRVMLVDGLPDKRAGGRKRRWRARTPRPGGEAKANPLTDVSDEGVADGTRGRARSPKRDAAELFDSFASAGMRVMLVDGLPDKTAGGRKRRWRARTPRPGGEAKARTARPATHD